jgi:hypothetical protein
MHNLTPMKVTGWKQGIYDQSPNRLEKLGTLRILSDGRMFRYAKAGATALSAGKMGKAAAINAAHVNETVAVANVAAYQHKVAITVTAGTAIADGDLIGGYLFIQHGTGLGYNYLIEGNVAISATGTAMIVDLEEPLKAAIETTTEITLCHSPWLGVVENTTQETFPCGIAPIAVTANYYYWCQTHGMAACLGTAGVEAVATMLIQGATAGTLVTISGGAGTTVDVDQPIVGMVYGTALVDAEYSPVWLQID